jgi:G:T-mismatch repair DNA endonuclease (very short patch repair protein)
MTLNVIPPGETVACDDRFACPFCGKLLKEVKGHLSKHFKGEHSLIHAYEELSSKSVIHMYEVEMLSASAISLKIRQEIGWLKPGKGHVLCFLKSKGISPRTTSEAGIQHYAKNPIWNKGLTRDEHPSIAKYGDGRFGSANPIHKTTHEERSKSNYLNKLREQSEEAYQGHCNHISDAVKTWFKDPENKKKYDAAYDNGREKQKVEVKKGIKAYYEKWAKKGLPPPNKTAWCSSIELAVKSALDALDVNYRHQWYAYERCYDFYLPDFNLAIEVNGDYWHAAERIFPDAETLHPDKKIKVKEIRDYDADKLERLVNHGHGVLVLWEHEIVNSNVNELVKTRLRLQEQRSHAKNQVT